MAGCKVKGSSTVLQDVLPRWTSTQKTLSLDKGGHFYMRIKLGNCTMGAVTSLIVTSGGTYWVFGRKLAIT